jgi:hypothetical protein
VNGRAALERAGAARLALLILALATLVALAVALRRPQPPALLAAPNVFSGPVNGGCYRQVTTCAIHVDSWQPLVTDNGQPLLGFQLAARAAGAPSSVTLYDFRTDVSNPPIGSYLPSLVRKGFPAQCGVTYELTLSAQDGSDPSFEEIGRTGQFTCPAPLFTPTPTATATATATATPSVTPTGTQAATTPTATATAQPGEKTYLPVIVDTFPRR